MVLSPLLAILLSDNVDKELERHDYCFARSVNDVHVYVCDQLAGGQVMTLRRGLYARLHLVVLTFGELSTIDPCEQEHPGLLHNFELNRSPRFTLYHDRSVEDTASLRNDLTRRLTRSKPLGLLSFAGLKKAGSRPFSASCNRTRITHVSHKFNGRFCPTSRPLLQSCAVLALFVFGPIGPSRMRSFVEVKYRLG